MQVSRTPSQRSATEVLTAPVLRDGHLLHREVAESGTARRSPLPVTSTSGQGSALRARPVCARGAGAVGQATVALVLHVLVSEEERKVPFSCGTKLTVTSGPSPRKV